MVWKKVDPKTGKVKYIQGGGTNFYLSTKRKGALNEIPEGWIIIQRKNGSIKLVEKN